MRKPSYPGSLFSELTTWLEDPFDGGESSVRFDSPLVGRRSGLPANHLSASPTGETHQVRFVPLRMRQTVGERVPEHVRMDTIDPRLIGATPEHLSNS